MTTAGAPVTAGLAVQNCLPLTVSSVRASGDDGNVPGNVLDDRLDTRWSSLGKGSSIDLDLGSARSISGAAIAWHLGDQRTNAFTLSVSSDGSAFTQVYSGQSSMTLAAQTTAFPARDARYLRITVNGNTLNDWASIAEARVCGSDPGSGTGASVVWRGDFETGNRSQWSETEMVNADRLQVVSSPTRQGSYALKATVRQGDNPINGSGNRNELLRMTHEPEGSEYYYKWSTEFASDFPSANTWQLFTQWHHEGLNGSPPVEFYVRGERIYLRVGGQDTGDVWSTPLVRGQWLDFIFHVKWSSNARVGFVELYYNGQLVLPKKYVATMYPGALNYLKIGLYRDAAVGPVGVVYHDGWTMARDLQDVLNPTSR
ncbi:carbohydrate-binding protein [Vitiosangium sp. GDMCC 1.1324]|nr:carbohydrate-binding protein [Vitiosangium sp. GDMCC 1.1324]